MSEFSLFALEKRKVDLGLKDKGDEDGEIWVGDSI